MTQEPLQLDISADEAFKKRQTKSQLKAEAMMAKMGWEQGQKLGKSEDNPAALLAPLRQTKLGIE